MENGDEMTAEQPNEARLLFEKDPRLLIADDDRPFLNRLAKAMSARGFNVTAANPSPKPWPQFAPNRRLSRSSICASPTETASM